MKVLILLICAFLYSPAAFMTPRRAFRSTTAVRDSWKGEDDWRAFRAKLVASEQGHVAAEKKLDGFTSSLLLSRDLF
jgi:hypothetical protein